MQFNLRFNFSLNRNRTWLASLGTLALCGLLAAQSAHAGELKIDFGVADGPTVGNSPNQVQAGYSAFDSNLPFGMNLIGDSKEDTSITRTYGDVSVRLQGSLRFFDMTLDVDDPLHGDLVEDGVRGGFGITMTLSGLAAGDYSLRMHHHAPYETEPTPAAQIYVDDLQVADSVWMSYGYDVGAGHSGSLVEFTSVGSPVVIFIEAYDEFTGSFPVFLNGFELTGPLNVPEPSSLVLACVGTAALGLVWRRRRAAR